MKKKIIRKDTTCRVCNSRDIKTILKLKDTPLEEQFVEAVAGTESPDVLDSEELLRTLFDEEELKKAEYIYNISKLTMTHCTQCNEAVFGNWIYEEGKYMCSSCRSVFA